MRGLRQTFGAVVALLAVAGSAHAADPTPLRLEATRAQRLFSDGNRFAVVQYRDRVVVLDSVSGGRWPVGSRGCRIGGTGGQRMLSHGRAILDCPSGPQVTDLATGDTSPLPPRVTIEGKTGYVFYFALGRWWAQAETDAPCGSIARSCNVYVNVRTGEQQVLPYTRLGSQKQTVYDLDDPDLSAFTPCAPHESFQPRSGQRTYEPPFLLDDTILRRCGRHRRIATLPGYLPDWMNLSGGRVSWGDPYRGADGRAYVYDIRRRALHTWRVPRAGQRRRTPGAAVHTRTRVYVAATLRHTRDAYEEPALVRVHSARIPRGSGRVAR